MKKVILLALGLMFVVGLLANDAWMRYPLMGADTPEEDSGFRSDYMSLGWWGADYGVHFDVSSSHNYNDIQFNLAHAFKAIELGEKVTMVIGKDEVPFGRISNPSGFANVFYIPGHMWGGHGHLRGTEWMAKFKGDISGVNWQIYYANEYVYDENEDYNPANAGIKLGYTISGADINFAVKMNTIAHDTLDPTMDWALGVDYKIMEMVNFAFQLTNRDDGSDDTDDLGYYAVMDYAPGVDLPVLGNSKPYFAYLSKKGTDGDFAEENDMLLGLNMTPKENVTFKLQYTMASDLDDDSLDFIAGFSF